MWLPREPLTSRVLVEAMLEVAAVCGLSHDLQRRLACGTEPREAVEQVVRAAGGLLMPFEVVPDSAETTALLYLVDLAARFLADRQAEAGARLGVMGTWLLPVLLDRIGRL